MPLKRKPTVKTPAQTAPASQSSAAKAAGTQPSYWDGTPYLTLKQIEDQMTLKYGSPYSPWVVTTGTVSASVVRETKNQKPERPVKEPEDILVHIANGPGEPTYCNKKSYTRAARPCTPLVKGYRYCLVCSRKSA
jgi:hypothetical protein